MARKDFPLLSHPSVTTGSARNKAQKLFGGFLKIGYFTGYYTAVPLKMYGKYGQSQIGFGQPNAKIGRKLASGRLCTDWSHIVISITKSLCVYVHLLLSIRIFNTSLCLHILDFKIS